MDVLLLMGAFGLALTMVLIVMRVDADVQCYGTEALVNLVVAFWCGIGSAALVYLAVT